MVGNQIKVFIRWNHRRKSGYQYLKSLPGQSSDGLFSVSKGAILFLTVKPHPISISNGIASWPYCYILRKRVLASDNLKHRLSASTFFSPIVNRFLMTKCCSLLGFFGNDRSQNLKNKNYNHERPDAENPPSVKRLRLSSKESL